MSQHDDPEGEEGAAPSASISTSRVKARFVMVSTAEGERPGLVLEWAKVDLNWSARVAYVRDDNATLVVEWLPPDQMTPVSDSQPDRL